MFNEASVSVGVAVKQSSGIPSWPLKLRRGPHVAFSRNVQRAIRFDIGKIGLGMV